MSAWTFWHWQRKLSGFSAVKPASAATFVPVQVTAERPEPVIEIIFSGGAP
jgi:hypothetical protein